MRLLFLLPLTTGLVSGFFWRKSADEMAYLTGTVTVVSLIATLVLAPWQIQLLVLGLTIFSTKKLLLKNEYKSITGSDRQVKTLEDSNAQNMVAGQVKGMYRGVPWQASQAIVPEKRQNKSNIKYRGASIVPHETELSREKERTLSESISSEE